MSERLMRIGQELVTKEPFVDGQWNTDCSRLDVVKETLHAHGPQESGARQVEFGGGEGAHQPGVLRMLSSTGGMIA